MKKIFNNNKMMLLFIGVFVVVFGMVVNTIGRKTYSVNYVCSDPMATLKDGKCIITRYVDCNSPSEITCRKLLPDDGFSCEHKSVTEEDGGYSHEFFCTKAAQESVSIDKPTCKNLTYNGLKQYLIEANSGYTVSNNERTNAGSQDVSVTLKNGFVWSDGDSSRTYSKECEIKKYQTDVSLSPSTSTEEAGSITVTVNGARLCPGKIVVSANDNINSSDFYEINTDTSKSFSYSVSDLDRNGSLMIKFEPNNGTNCLSDTATFEYKVPADNTIKKIQKPTCEAGLEYDKNEKNLISNLESGYSLTIKDSSGNVVSSPVNAGTYTVTAKLNSRYKWLDETTDDVTLSCSIGKAKSSVSVNDATGSGMVGYLTSTNASISSKCAGRITLITDGLTYTGTTNFPLEFEPSSMLRELNFKVTRTCGRATATVNFTSSSENCSDASAVYTYTVDEGENCAVDIDEEIEIPYDEVVCPKDSIYDGKAKTVTLPLDDRYTIRINGVSGVNKIQNVGTYVITAEINDPDDYKWVGTDETKVTLKTCTISSNSSPSEPSSSSSSKPSSSSSSSKPSSSSSSNPSSSSSGGNDLVFPITSITLGSESLCINEQTSLFVSSMASGKIVIENDNTKVVKLSSSTYDLTANEEKVFKLLGLKKGSANIKVRFIFDDITRYGEIEKNYTVLVDNCGGNQNVDKNPATGNIMLFIVWVIGFGAVGYSFWTFRYSFKK